VAHYVIELLLLKKWKYNQTPIEDLLIATPSFGSRESL